MKNKPTKPFSAKQELAARKASWEWQIVKDGHAKTAIRGVAMAREWLGGKSFAEIGRKYNISGSQVGRQCGRVFRGLRRLEIIDQFYLIDNRIVAVDIDLCLAAIERAEYEFYKL